MVSSLGVGFRSGSRRDSYVHQGLFSGLLQPTSRIRPDAYGLWRSGWQVVEL
jgi:hypothetical protein